LSTRLTFPGKRKKKRLARKIFTSFTSPRSRMGGKTIARGGGVAGKRRSGWRHLIKRICPQKKDAGSLTSKAHRCLRLWGGDGGNLRKIKKRGAVRHRKILRHGGVAHPSFALGEKNAMRLVRGGGEGRWERDQVQKGRISDCLRWDRKLSSDRASLISF